MFNLKIRCSLLISLHKKILLICKKACGTSVYRKHGTYRYFKFIISFSRRNFLVIMTSPPQFSICWVMKSRPTAFVWGRWPGRNYFVCVLRCLAATLKILLVSEVVRVNKTINYLDENGETRGKWIEKPRRSPSVIQYFIFVLGLTWYSDNRE